MTEMTTYMRVPQVEEGGGVVIESDAEDAGNKRSFPRRAMVLLNQYAQISSAAYQHGVAERKLSFSIFLVFFVCFVFTSLFVFSAGDLCSSYSEGIHRLQLERDHYKNQATLLSVELSKLTGKNSPGVPSPPSYDTIIP
jgi:hypothetical protein